MSSRIMRVALNLEQCFQRPPGGIGRYVAELARVLPDVDDPGTVMLVPFVARHSGHVVTQRLRALGLTTDALVLPYPRRVLYELWNRWGLADPTRGRNSLAMRDVDVVHAPSVAVPPRARVPLVVTVHDAAPVMYPETFSRRGRRFHELGLAATARRADAVIAPTAVAADEIASMTAIPRERIHPIHHGVDHTLASDADVERTRAQFGLGADPYVLWVGTLEPRKDVGVLVDAFARGVVASELPHRLVLVGPGGWLDGEAEAARTAAPLGDRVVFTGSVDGASLRALYRGADLFALPSRHEGFGLPVVEAMAQETPVVASDLPVLREVGGGAAEFVPAGDAAAWAEALATLLADEDARAKMGAAGREHALRFTWARSAAAHVAVYDSLR